MFTVIYDLQSKKVINIVSGKSDEENLKKAIDTTRFGYLFVEDLPILKDMYRQEVKVEDDHVIVVDKELTETQEKQIQIMELNSLIAEKKQILEKYKEDVEQVALFNMERADYAEKKEACAGLIIDIRELEKERNELVKSISNPIE